MRACLRWGVAVGLFVLPLGLTVAPFVPHRACELVIDMQAGDRPTLAAGRLEVWVNSTSGRSFTQDCTPGVRRTYRVALDDYASVDYLRLDPTDQPDVPVRIHEIRIESEQGPLHSFTAKDLASWHTNAEESSLDGDALVLRAGHRDPQLDGRFPAIRLPGAPESLPARLALQLIARDGSRETVLLILASSALLALVLGLRKGGRTAAGVVLASVPLTYAALRLVGRLGGRPPDGRSALGYALYSGYPKSLEMPQALLLAAVPAVVALLAVFLRRRLMRSPAPATEAVEPERRRKWLAGLVLALVIVGLAGYFCPDLASACPSAGSPVALEWDRNNSLVWQYLIQTGAKPYKDFWYPYSGQMLFELPFPYGDTCLALHRFLLFTVFLLAVYRSAGRSLPVTLAIFGTVFGLYANNFFEWPERYALVVNVVLAHLGVERASPRLGWGHVLFWVAAVHAAVIEPTSAVYAGVPLLLSFALDALRAPGEFRAGLLTRLVREFAVPAGALAGVGVYLAVRGELAGFVSFMASLGSQAAYGAYPIELSSWLQLGSPSVSFLIWSAVLLIGAGLVQEFGAPLRQGQGRLLLLLGVAGVMLLLKQFMRPHIADQLLIVNVVGLLFYLFAGQRANAWQAGGAALAAGLLFANLAGSSAPVRVKDQIAAALDRARASAPYLALHSEQRRALTALRFAPQRFQLTGDHLHAAAALCKFARTGPAAPLFVLGDDPIFYILTGARPYFHTNGYNAAPIAEQRRVVRMLTEAPPEVVLWRSTDPGVDGVPPVLRDALVYEHVILHYVPDDGTPQGALALLRRRRPDEPVAIDFWRERLGAVLNLGHIPRFADPARLRPGAEQAEFLTVHVTDAVAPAADVPDLPQIGGYHPQGRPLAIPVECAGRRFTVVLSVVPGQSEYHVPLNRVWFWGTLKKAGLSPTLGDAPAGVQVGIDRRAIDDGILY